jgi:hypothetical protein
LENYEQASATNIILEFFRYINLKLTAEILTSKQKQSARGWADWRSNNLLFFFLGCAETGSAYLFFN